MIYKPHAARAAIKRSIRFHISVNFCYKENLNYENNQAIGLNKLLLHFLPLFSLARTQYIYMGLQILQDICPIISKFHNSYFVLCDIGIVTIHRPRSQLYSCICLRFIFINCTEDRAVLCCANFTELRHHFNIISVTFTGIC